TDQRGNERPGALDVATGEGGVDRHGRVAQPPARDGHIRRESRRADDGARARAHHDARRGVHRAGDAVVAVDRSLDRVEGATEDRDRVRRDRRLPDETIEEHTGRGAQWIRATHHLAAATSKPTVSPTMPAAPSTSPV